MKIFELFEATKPAKPRLAAEISLGHSYEIPNYDKGTKAAIEALYKKAKAKFAELKSEHPNKLKFETLTAANAYVKTMEYPGWPIYAHTILGKGDYRKSRVEPADFSDWVEPPEETAADIKIEDVGGKVLVSVQAKKGPLLNVITSVAWAAIQAKKKVTNMLGKQITDPFRSRSNKVNIFATKEEVEKYLVKATKDHEGYAADKAQREADKNDPVKKKEANQFKYQQQKERTQELHDKYGKDIVERVKIKSLIEDGDDGYQWSLWVDGRRQKSGMTRYQAEGEQRMMWAYLLKVSKMSPEELKKEANIAAGWKAYFMMQRLETELNSYLHQMNKSAKGVVDSATQTKDAISKAAGKVDPAKEMESLIAKLRKKTD